MSKEELLRFRQDLRAKDELKSEFKKIKKAAKVKAVVGFATSKGYAIDVSDLASPSV
jgi:hypothetical protein